MCSAMLQFFFFFLFSNSCRNMAKSSRCQFGLQSIMFQIWLDLLDILEQVWYMEAPSWIGPAQTCWGMNTEPLRCLVFNSRVVALDPLSLRQRERLICVEWHPQKCQNQTFPSRTLRCNMIIIVTQVSCQSFFNAVADWCINSYIDNC